MAVSYKPLFKLMIDRDIKRGNLVKMSGSCLQYTWQDGKQGKMCEYVRCRESMSCFGLQD